MSSPSRTRITADARLTKVETSLSNLADALNGFVAESREYRRHQDAERDKIWTAIQQADRSRAITWPMIFTAITVFLAVIGAAAKVGHVFTETRILQLEERIAHAREIGSVQEEHLRWRLDRIETR
jgi:hypothetical protein